MILKHGKYFCDYVWFHNLTSSSAFGKIRKARKIKGCICYCFF